MQFGKQQTAERTFIVADDLTGACDAAVAFAQRGSVTRVLLGPVDQRALHAAAVVAISTASRDVPVEDAVGTIERAAAHAMPMRPVRVVKKVDSVFRGNSAAEIAAAHRAFRPEVMVIAPAYPELGRRSLEGVLHVRHLDHAHTVPALQMLRQAGLDPLHVPATLWAERQSAALLKEARQKHGGILYCDAAEPNDLHTIVRQAGSSGREILWVGSGGLAHALGVERSETPACVPPMQRGRVLLFVGTEHPVGRQQLAHLQACVEVSTIDPAQDDGKPCRPTAEVVLIQVACGRTAPADIAAVCASFHPEAISCVLMTGGDTAALVSQAMGMQALDLYREFAPGIPMGTAVGGPFHGRTVLLKSGGFGPLETLTRVVQQFAPHSREAREVCVE